MFNTPLSNIFKHMINEYRNSSFILYGEQYIHIQYDENKDCGLKQSREMWQTATLSKKTQSVACSVSFTTARSLSSFISHKEALWSVFPIPSCIYQDSSPPGYLTVTDWGGCPAYSVGEQRPNPRHPPYEASNNVPLPQIILVPSGWVWRIIKWSVWIICLLVVYTPHVSEKVQK